MTKLPAAFTPLSDAVYQTEKVVSVIGTVIDFVPAAPTRSGDYNVTFTLQDESNVQEGNYPGLKFRFFDRFQGILPKVESLGDIMVIRNIRITVFHGRTLGMSNRISVQNLKTQVFSFPGHSVPVPDYKETFMGGQKVLPHSSYGLKNLSPSLPEMEYAIYLRHEAPKNMPFLQIAPSTAPKVIPTGPRAMLDSHTPTMLRTKKFVLIKDITPGLFYDICGEVVKIFPNGSVLDLYISDYTEHKDLYSHEAPKPLEDGAGRDGDEFGYASRFPKKQWQGPYGKMTLPVTLWSPHSYWAQDNVREGDFVYLKNIRTKISTSRVLDAALHEDRKTPDEIGIRKVQTGNDVDGIKRRKAQYEHQREVQTVRAPNAPVKASAKKREKKKLQKAKERKELEEKALTTSFGDSNRHIRCGFPDVRLSSLTEIMSHPYHRNKTPGGIEYDLPFINAKYRTRVRVVDFKPDNLMDFARPLDDSAYNKHAPFLRNMEDIDMSDGESVRWEWAFCLLVEDAMSLSGKDAPPRMPLFVAQDGAECLLKMDASNLRSDERKLEELREKLFVLWGNLEELKCTKFTLPLAADRSHNLKNNPLECCIEEYGYLDPTVHSSPEQAQRLYRMASTTIM